MKQRIITLIALLCTFAGTASATTKTYTVTGGQGGTQAEFYAQFSDGSTSSGQVNWTYNSTAEISFSLPGGLTLKLSDAAKQLVYSNGAIGGRGSTTLTVSSSTYIYHVRILDSSGNVIQLDANGEAVAHDGVAECDYWNMTKSFSHTFSNGILFSKIEVSYDTAIPITDAVITGLSSQYIVSNTAIMPTPTVTWHGTTLTSGTHYTLSYLNNTAAGTATVKATGKGIFSSSTSVSANYTLVWATYSVRFNKNNDAATGTMSNQDFTYSTAQNLTANAFSRTGYTFDGWNTAANGSGTSYTNGQEVLNLTATNGGTVDLYAQWTPITYTLRLHHNDGTEAYTDMAMTYDQPKNIQSISRTGYTFDGWSTAPDGDVVYTDGQEVQNLTATNGGIIDLYAQWTANTYSITYDLAGGTVATANPASYSIESNNFTLANPTRTGYTFAGWTGTDLNEPTMEVTIPTGSTEHRSYTATWTAHTYSVHFDKNSDGATGTIADQAFTYGVSHQLSANTFTAPFGYQFYRWTTNADGSGDSYTNGQEIINLTADDGHTVTLYAQWEVIPWSGTGSSETPYIISYPSQLDLLATRVNSDNSYYGKFFKLGADIAYDPTALDANGENYTTIGNNSTQFRGTFNGDGHTISGIRINKTGSTDADRYLGLFGYIGYNGTVQNVILDDAHITGFNQVGGITGSMSSATIKNCLVLNTAIIATYANSKNVGAISGIYSGTFTANYYHNCSLTKDGTTSTTNIGSGGNSISDRDGARSVHALTLPDGVSATGESVVIDGTTYYASNTTVTLSCILPEGYTAKYIVNGTAISGNSFTMPAADATVSTTLTDVWGMAEGVDGSQAHPYVITTTAGLDLLAQRVNSGNSYYDKYFVLGADITYTHTTDWDDATSTENNYTPIGNGYEQFYGTFDGQGHTVSGIRIYKDGSDYTADAHLGLFGALTGVVKNVTVSDMRITGYDFVGGIAGYKPVGDNNNIENCHATATVCLNAVQDGAKRFGGIVGANDMGKIKSCTSAVTITVADNLTGCRDFGGIAGYMSSYFPDNVNVSNCLAMGVTIPDVPSSGVIVGLLSSGVLSNNFYSGCTLGGTPTASGIGVGFEYSNEARHDVTANDGAVPVPQQLADNATDNSDVIDSHDGETVSIVLSGRTLYKDGDWNTLCLPFSLTAEQVAASPLAGWTLMTLDTDAGSYGHITGFENSALYLNFKPATSIVAGTPYIVKWIAQPDLTISSEEEWNTFCENVNNGTSYAGKTVRLAADISVSTMVGTYYYPFEGTFDGDGHTLTVTLNNNGATGTNDASYGVAPFRFTSGATIMNLHVCGTITTSTRKYAAGIVGMTKSGTNTIQNCRVSAEIYSTIDGDGTHGGFVGKACGEVNISNCLFDGVLTTSEVNGTNSCGGFVGWRDDPCSLSISNSLYDPAVIPDGKYAIGTYNSCTFTRNNDECVSNCYYTTVLGDAQGDDASAMSNDQLLTALGNGWINSNGKVVPKKEAMPNIMDPVFYGVTVENVNPEDRKVVSQDGKVSFTGTYDALSFTEDNHSILFLGTNNTLYYPESGASINPFRAYFQLNGLTAADINPNNVKMFFGDERPTDGVGEVQGPKFKVQGEDIWSDLNGRRINGKPAQKGIYINNGHKVVIK